MRGGLDDRGFVSHIFITVILAIGLIGVSLLFVLTRDSDEPAETNQVDQVIEPIDVNADSVAPEGWPFYTSESTGVRYYLPVEWGAPAPEQRARSFLLGSNQLEFEFGFEEQKILRREATGEWVVYDALFESVGEEIKLVASEPLPYYYGSADVFTEFFGQPDRVIGDYTVYDRFALGDNEYGSSIYMFSDSEVIVFDLDTGSIFSGGNTNFSTDRIKELELNYRSTVKQIINSIELL